MTPPPRRPRWISWAVVRAVGIGVIGVGLLAMTSWPEHVCGHSCEPQPIRAGHGRLEFQGRSYCMDYCMACGVGSMHEAGSIQAPSRDSSFSVILGRFAE